MKILDMIKTYRIRGEKKPCRVFAPELLRTQPLASTIVIENVNGGYWFGAFAGFEFPPPSAGCPPEEMPDVILRFYPEGYQHLIEFSCIKYIAPFED